MAITHAAAGEAVNLFELAGPAGNKTATIIKTPRLEVIRLVLPAGKRIPPHAVAGEIVVQCLTGKVLFEARETQQTLAAGSLLYLEGGDPHALEALEDATVLVTISLLG